MTIKAAYNMQFGLWGGMLVQVRGLLIVGLDSLDPLSSGLVGSVMLGIGTAMIYPGPVSICK